MPAFFLVACKKNDPPPEASKLELLTGGKWQLTHFYYQAASDNIRNDFLNTYYTACELDDIYEFTTDNALIRSSGKDSCTGEPPYGIESSNWEIDSLLTQIVLAVPFGFTTTYKINTLNAQTLQLEQDAKNYVEEDVIYTYVFKAAE